MMQSQRTDMAYQLGLLLFRVGFIIVALAAMAVVNLAAAAESAVDGPVLQVRSCDDFEVNGRGDAAAWGTTNWVDLVRRPMAHHDYQARFKVLYSKTGLYVLLDGTDSKLTSSMQHDFDDLWKEDVFEFFLWTDPRHSIYFEYEISPLGHELPILVPNYDGKYLGWRPWHYDGPRRTRKAVTVRAGTPQENAAVLGWRAEVFVPYELLTPLGNVPPQPGTRWRANFYRIDHDGGESTTWDWARVGASFHDFHNFGTLVFQ